MAGPSACARWRPAAGDALRVRWAGPADNEALIELVRSCPMDGDIRIYFDRAPDFFQLSALQGSGARLCVIEDRQPGALAACAALAEYPHVFVNGEPRRVGYACDLRVRPARRGGLLLKRLYDFMGKEVAAREIDLAMTTVMAGNEAMAPVLQGRAGLVPYIRLATMRNYAIQFLLRKRESRTVTVRRATEADLPAMVGLWNRVQQGKQFAPAWDEAELRARLAVSPGHTIDGYYLAYRGDRLTGLCATWDQRAFKRMVVLGYNRSLQRLQRWYNPLARLLGRAPFPPIGSDLPYFYATQLCAETAEDLRALLTRVYNDHLGSRYLFCSTMLDVNDPLSAALEGFMSSRFDIILYALDVQGRWSRLADSARPAYFDHSMV